MNLSPNPKSGEVPRRMLLGKLWYSISGCVCFQTIIVLLYIGIANFSRQIDVWGKSVGNVLTSLNTWTYLLCFTMMSLTQIVTFGKEYLIKISYERSRFNKYLSVFSIKTLFVAFLQMLGGGFSSWLYLSLVEDDKQIIYIQRDEKVSLRESSFFILMNGLWVGMYHFVQVQTSDRALVFPVIYQEKFVRFKSQFTSLFNYSKHFSIYPTFCFIVFYKIFGNHLCEFFMTITNLHIDVHDSSFLQYGFVWIFTTFYIINVNFMKFSFELFLTQPIEHSIIEIENETSLHEALLFDDIPIIQHLACLDFYLMSIWSPQRRQMLFTLSQPGGHPHTWNHIIESILKLLSKFQEPIGKLLEEATISEESLTINDIPSIEMLSQSCFNLEGKYSNIRHMSLSYLPEAPQIVEVERRSLILRELPNRFRSVIVQKVQNSVEYIKNLTFYKYFFDNLPEAQILECLLNGQTIVWLVQGLSNVIVKSCDEDPYGVIQKDLSVVLTNLVKLKINMDKLNKVTSPGRKGSNGEDFSRKMHNNINNATRRSLTNICRTFKDYLNDIPVERSIRTELLTFI